MTDFLKFDFAIIALKKYNLIKPWNFRGARTFDANGRLTENVSTRISSNSNFNPNPNAQKRFQENKMRSFFEQVSKYQLQVISVEG